MTDQNKLPWDVRQQALWIVRGYERARREYLRQRREILDAGGENYVTYQADGETRRAYLPSSHQASRATENVAIRLEALEKTETFRQMRAVEHARARIGEGMPPAIRDALQDAIMLNCMNGRKYPFERLYVVGLGRSEFYRIRDAFFRSIAEEVGLW